MIELKAGDVVRLKSGSVPMTLSRFCTETGLPDDKPSLKAACVWFVRRELGSATLSSAISPSGWDGPFVADFPVEALSKETP